MERYINTCLRKDYLCVLSLLTVSFLRPLARREANTRRPFADAIRSLNPCLFFLLRCDGWKVRFMLCYFNVFSKNGVQIYKIFMAPQILFGKTPVYPAIITI